MMFGGVDRYSLNDISVRYCIAPEFYPPVWTLKKIITGGDGDKHGGVSTPMSVVSIPHE